MINYGVVYPQAILVFVMTLLYSVVQPLMVIFGAIYFGVAYVVYKYKLLFGQWPSSHPQMHRLNLRSVLQAIRIARPSVDYNLHTIDLGRHHVLGIYDWDICSQESIYHILAGVAPPHRDALVVVVHYEDLCTTESTRQLELGL